MNNAQFITQDEPKIDKSAILRERTDYLAELVDALQNIAGSHYWKVLQQNVFSVDLEKAKSRLAKEKDTTAIFRLQGNIEWGEKFNLEPMIAKYKEELIAIRKKING